MQKLKVLLGDFEKCSGCRICEMVCSLEHAKMCSPAKSRISIIKWEEEGISIPSMCQQCEEPLCMKVCPVEGIRRDKETGAILTDPDLCIGCKMCIMVCPFGGPSVDPEEGKIIRCDLCEGDPKCVNFCPQEALMWVRADKIGLMRKRDGLKRLTSSLELIVTESEGN
jgi:Fe-S-cluster-containing dehydrogenase component